MGKLSAMTILISVITVGLYYLDKKIINPSGKKSKKLQILYGVIFGLIAISGTEFGILVNGATMNVRDAGPVCAALFFSPEAGIIAGLIGGIERYFAVYWGAGEFTRWACTIGTIFSGFFAAFVKKYVLREENPSISGAFLVGGVAEVFHMLMLFVLRSDQITMAHDVLVKCAPIMIPLVALASTIPAYAINAIDSERIIVRVKHRRRIAQNIAVGLFISVVLAFTATVSFDAFLQTKIAANTAENNIKNALEDAKYDIESVKHKNSTNKTNYVNKELSNRHIGNEGYIIAFDAKTMAPLKYSHMLAPSIEKDIKDIIKGGEEFQLVRKDANQYIPEAYYSYVLADDLYLVAVYPTTETEFNRSISFSILAMLEIVILAVVFLMVFLLIKIVVLKGLNKINDDLASITQGNLDTHIDVESSDEFVALSDSINATVDTLKEYISEAEKRMDEDIRLAKTIQGSSLPNVYPDDNRFELYASMDAAREVGGDFYDFYPLGEDKYVFLIADVSGKGIPAAMFMMKAKSVIKGIVETGASPAVAFTKANEKLCDDNTAEMFVTAWLGIMNCNTGHLVYANAGHNPPVRIHTDGSKEFIKTPAGFVLAGIEGFEYKNNELDLDEGEAVFLYTDGVTEAINKDEELFGEDKLLNVLDEAGSSNTRYMCKLMKAKVEEFAGDMPQFDDITTLAVRRKTEEDRNNTLVTDASKGTMADVMAFIEKYMEANGIDMAMNSKIMVVVDELYSNIINYSQATYAVVKLADLDDRLMISFHDNGTYYNPMLKDDPDITLSAKERQIGGLGIYIVKNMAKDVKYTRVAGKNIIDVVLEK